jgi:Family of unknown function (DUF6788)
MQETLEDLERQKNELYRQLAELGDFRRGTISANYRKCGKAYCVCARAGHPGHGPQYLWNATIKGKSRAQNLRLGAELEKVGREVENYRRVLQWWDQWIEVNEKICQRKPVNSIAEEELEELKKKLKRKYATKRSRRSDG